MGAFAEFERALNLERQREGIAAAKARGAYTGRKPALIPEQAHALRERAAAGERKSALAKEFDTISIRCGPHGNRRGPHASQRSFTG
jgi:DNA invertase Pin-like site-specific DNA recombinase